MLQFFFIGKPKKLRDTSLQENINLGYVRCILDDLRRIVKVDSLKRGFQDLICSFFKGGGQ